MSGYRLDVVGQQICLTKSFANILVITTQIILTIRYLLTDIGNSVTCLTYFKSHEDVITLC